MRPPAAQRLSFVMTETRWWGSSPAMGSSAISTGASTASERASITRVRSPPESWVPGAGPARVFCHLHGLEDDFRITTARAVRDDDPVK